jgi:hypothetical protein
MFYRIILDIQAANYAMPEFISYNGGDIPMAYSPLAFYVAAGMNDVFGFPVLDILRFLPLFFSILTLVAVFLLARDVLASERMAAIAVLIFSLLPQSFEWQIAGGGLTRSPGLFFALLAIHQAFRLSNRADTTGTILLGTFLTLTVLFHQEYALFVGTSAFVFLWFSDRRGDYFRCAIIALIGALACSAAWWGLVFLRHGADPFWQASQTSNSGPLNWGVLVSLNYTREHFFPLFAALGLLGVLTCLRARAYLLPVWLVALFVLDTRIVATSSAAVTAMLSTIALTQAILPFMTDSATANLSTLRVPRLAWLLGIWAIVFGSISLIASSTFEQSGLKSLSVENRNAVRWVAANAKNSTFLIVTGMTNGGTDRMSEWFPALTGSVSIATFQGQEWTGQWQRTLRSYDDLQACANSSVICLHDWEAKYARSHESVLLSHQGPQAQTDRLRSGSMCCPGLKESLLNSPEYQLVYDEQDVVIFRKIR